MTDNPYCLLAEHWKKRQPALDREEKRLIAGKDTFRNRLRGFLTIAYYRRDRLVEQGDVVLGLVFREWRGNPMETGNCFRDWVLFSPSTEVSLDPSILVKTADALLNAQEKAPKNRKELRFHDAMSKPLSDAAYLEVPPEITDGKLIYLSIIERPYSPSSDFRLGLWPFLVNRSISREILLLPARFWPEEQLKAYKEGHNPFWKEKGEDHG